jgi:hypothetical protein
MDSELGRRQVPDPEGPVLSDASADRLAQPGRESLSRPGPAASLRSWNAVCVCAASQTVLQPQEAFRRAHRADPAPDDSGGSTAPPRPAALRGGEPEPGAVLTDHGREYGGRLLRYPYELYLTVQRMEHRNTKVHTSKITGRPRALPPGA